MTCWRHHRLFSKPTSRRHYCLAGHSRHTTRASQLTPTDAVCVCTSASQGHDG
jgi:hypothetical protein